MKTRYTIYKYGFVREDGTVEDDKRIVSFYSQVGVYVAKESKASFPNPEDYYIVQEKFDGLYWVAIEGTEIF